VLHESLDYRIVSSVGSNGLVYFKGGNGQCGWPANLRRAEGEDPSTYPRFGDAELLSTPVQV
jgi:hypothetical protein